MEWSSLAKFDAWHGRSLLTVYSIGPTVKHGNKLWWEKCLYMCLCQLSRQCRYQKKYPEQQGPSGWASKGPQNKNANISEKHRLMDRSIGITKASNTKFINDPYIRGEQPGKHAKPDVQLLPCNARPEDFVASPSSNLRPCSRINYGSLSL